MYFAARSFTEPPGFRNSALPSTAQPGSSDAVRRRSSGGVAAREAALVEQVRHAPDRPGVVATSAEDRRRRFGVEVVQRAPPAQVSLAPFRIVGARNLPAAQVVRAARDPQRLARAGCEFL